MSDPLVNAMTQAIEGQNLYHGRYGTTPAGSATARAILAHLRDLGWTLAATPAPLLCGYETVHPWEPVDGPTYCDKCGRESGAATPAPLDVDVRGDVHALTFPPHPGGFYISSALCSCGGFQWDADNVGALVAATNEVWTDFRQHIIEDAALAATPAPLDVVALRCAAIEVVIEATSDDFDPTTREWGELIEQLESAATSPLAATPAPLDGLQKALRRQHLEETHRASGSCPGWTCPTARVLALLMEPKP